MKTINDSSEIYKQIVVSDDTLLSTSDYINDKVNDVLFNRKEQQR